MCSCDVSVKFQNEELFRPREEWARADKTPKHLLGSFSIDDGNCNDNATN